MSTTLISAVDRPVAEGLRTVKQQMPPDDARAAIRVRGLVKQYRDGTEANRGIDLEVRRGELVSILGPNGAGKTTFLRQITTELKPSAGSVEIFGLDAVAAPQQAKRAMGITPQEAGVFETLRVREHLELFGGFKGLAKREARRSATEILHELDLDAEANKRVGDLSGGQRRRILIGLALLGNPPLLVLDEPTTGLDPVSRRAVWKVIRRRVTDGCTVLLSTHYIEEAERLSHRVAIISAGKMIAIGTLDELLSRLTKSYRLSYRERLDETQVRYFAAFAEAQRYIAEQRIAEYSLARASLEDVYFELTGHRFEDGPAEETPSPSGRGPR
ncbi:MAG TPA: ABC transporter ATP-binding protein [Pyrinomonadaceae bacterium]|nr:ABC transporter ATP-binding protein [Pyrinomonadaceae bacterium]